MRVTFINALLCFCAFQFIHSENHVQKKMINRSYTFNDKNDNDFVKISINIIKNCYNENGNIVISGNFYGARESLLLKNLYGLVTPLSMISVYESGLEAREESNTTSEIELTYPATGFVIIAPSIATITEALVQVKNSIWWNHEGSFLIVDTSLEDDCRIALNSLQFVWSLNILFASLLCRSSNNKIHLFTYNPFSQYAPKFWRVLVTSDKMWTLLEHTIEKNDNYDSQFCENLNFSKTVNLHGYKIKIGVWLMNLSSTHPEATGDLNDIDGEKGDIARAVWNYLNATVDLAFSTFTKLDDDHQPLVLDLQSDKIDYILNVIFQSKKWKIMTYPYSSSGLCAMSRIQSISSFEKILKIFSITSWLIVLGLCFVSVVILRFILRETLSESSLDLLRMIVGMSTQKEPKISLFRAFFIILVIVYMAFNSYFQSRLNGMYVASSSDLTIDTAEDLNRSDYLIYGHAVFKEMLFYKNLRDRYRIPENLTECEDRFNKEEPIVCLYPCTFYNVTERNGIHVSRERMLDLNLALRIRKDWPLVSQVNQVLGRLAEAGLLGLYQERERRQFYKYIEVESEWKSITLEQSTADFLLLSWSLLLASCIFIYEIIINKFRKLTITTNSLFQNADGNGRNGHYEVVCTIM